MSKLDNLLALASMAMGAFDKKIKCLTLLFFTITGGENGET